MAFVKHMCVPYIMITNAFTTNQYYPVFTVEFNDGESEAKPTHLDLGSSE